MAISINTQWHGAQIIDQVTQRITADMLKLGNMVVSIAERYAPKRTGQLATSIGFDWNQADFTLVFTVGAPYGIFVEYGTRNMRPQPYLRPALNTVGPIFGFNTEMAFANTPHINAPILAAGRDFHLPANLSAKQLKHVAKWLLPTSRRHHIANAGRAKMHVRKG